MKKLIHSDSYDYDMPAVSLVDIHSRGVDRTWLQKRAAALTDEISSVRPENGKTHLHVIAMGAGERYGPNRNADYFSRKDLLNKHATFVSNGHVYKHHQNKDPKKASGQVKSSAYNDAMDRVELIIAVDNNKWEPELQKLASGNDLPVSMACTLDYDVCSVCGNKAPTREAYCGHMKKMAGQTLADGRKVYVDNPNPTFFDISGVHRPADRIAYTLRKVASDSQLIATGADLYADVMDNFTPTIRFSKRSAMSLDKRKILGKLAEIEKEIGGIAQAADNPVVVRLSKSFAEPVCSMSSEESDILASTPDDRMNQLMSALGEARVSLPLRDFIKIVVGKDLAGSELQSIEQKLPGVFSRILEDDPETAVMDGDFDPSPLGSLGIPKPVKDIIGGLIPKMSLNPESVGNRISVVTIRKIPGPMLNGGCGISTIKSAAADKWAEALARKYAAYKLAFVTAAGAADGADWIERLSVIQNYVNH